MQLQLLKENESPREAFTPFPLINAVLNGKQEGELYDDGDGLFIIHKSAFSWLMPDRSFNGSENIVEHLLSINNIPSYFHIYDAPKHLINKCEKSKLINTKLRKRVQMKFVSKELSLLDLTLPSGYNIEKITEKNFASLAVFDLNIDSKYWKSKIDFLNNGFGFSVYNDNHEPVSICYTACVANNEAEIDIATLKAYQKKGFGKVAAVKFVEYCLANNITANWDCFEDNLSSLNTAQGVGFCSVYQYDLLSIFIK